MSLSMHRVYPHRWMLGGLFLAAGMLTANACDLKDDEKQGAAGAGASAEPSRKGCSQDDECPAGEGCDREGGELAAGYCTPLCDDASECPNQVTCPGNQPTDNRSCDERTEHRDGKGICDLYDGSNTPITCTYPGTPR